MTAADLDALWDFGNPASSEGRFRAFIRDVPDETLRAEAITQLVRAIGLQGRFDEALAHLEALDRRPDAYQPRIHVRRLLERGRVLNSSGKRVASQPLFEQAWNLACEANLDGLAVDAAHMIAIVTNGDEQLAWNERAIGLAEGSNDPTARKWLASLYNNTAWSFHDRGDYDRALDLFERASALRKQRGEVANERIARWCVARCLRSMGRYVEALGMQQALMDERHDDSGYGDEEIGELMLALGRAQEAQVHFARAYSKLSADAGFSEQEPKRLERLLLLSQGRNDTAP